MTQAINSFLLILTFLSSELATTSSNVDSNISNEEVFDKKGNKLKKE